jgi:hypothetical protein
VGKGLGSGVEPAGKVVAASTGVPHSSRAELVSASPGEGMASSADRAPPFAKDIGAALSVVLAVGGGASPLSEESRSDGEVGASSPVAFCMTSWALGLPG